MNTFNLKNGHLAYVVKGTGHPVVFIHGFSLDSRMWDDQFDVFSKTNMVLRYDMRGFGQSSLPSKEYSHHQDLYLLLKHLELETVTLVGLSLGGEVAIDFILEYPEMVSGVVLLDSSLGGFKSTVDWNVHAESQGVEKAKQNWLEHKVFHSLSAKKLMYTKVASIVSDYSGWHWLHSDPRARLKPTAMERLSEIIAPVKILVGEHDLKYFHDISHYLHELIPQSECLIVPDAGHMVNMENATFVNEQITKLLNRKS